jgi:hypothetical protein
MSKPACVIALRAVKGKAGAELALSGHAYGCMRTQVRCLTIVEIGPNLFGMRSKTDLEPRADKAGDVVCVLAVIIVIAISDLDLGPVHL